MAETWDSQELNDSYKMFLSREIDVKLCKTYTCQNSLQWQCRILVMWWRRRHLTILLHCHWLEFWCHVPDTWIILSIISIKNEKLLHSKNKRSKLEFLRLLWDIVIFRLVAYLLNIICLILRILYKILHIYVLV